MAEKSPSKLAAAVTLSVTAIALSFIVKQLIGFLRKGTNRVFSKDKKVKVIFILGGPGSGKGTQCANIVEHYGFTHLSAGDLLRAEIVSGSKNGTIIKEMMEEGKIVPSEITVQLLVKAMQENKNDKFLIDGFPRNEENRATFESITGIVPEFVLYLDCSEEEMRKRLLNRNQGREDDSMQIIPKRFKVFKECTLPVIDYYSSIEKVHKIDGGKPVQDVFDDIKCVFSQHGIKAISNSTDQNKRIHGFAQ